MCARHWGSAPPNPSKIRLAEQHSCALSLEIPTPPVSMPLWDEGGGPDLLSHREPELSQLEQILAASSRADCIFCAGPHTALTLRTDVPTYAKNMQQNTCYVVCRPGLYLTVFFHTGESKGTLTLHSSNIVSQIILDHDTQGHTAVTLV